MYGSYGSYSSMCMRQMAAPINISTSRSTTACAFPSWPQRSSLACHDSQSASSYLSDEDLFLDGPDDYMHPSSSASSRSNSNASSVSSSQSRMRPHQPQQLLQPQEPVLSDEELLEQQRERQAYQRQIVRALLAEEKRKQDAAVARRQQRRANSATRKSPKQAKQTSVSESTSGIDAA